MLNLTLQFALGHLLQEVLQTRLFLPAKTEPVWVCVGSSFSGKCGNCPFTHPVLKREDRLGKEPFAGFGTVVEDITGSGYTKNQPILLGPFWENAFFVFLHYNFKQKTSQNRAKISLNLTSEGLKYPPEVRLQHETCSTICGTHVQAILNQKKLTGLAGGVREDQNRSKYCPEYASFLALEPSGGP